MYYSFHAIFNIIAIVIGSLLLLIDLYTIINHGNLVVKVNKNKGLMILWSALLIFWCLALGFNIKSYITDFKDAISNDSLVIFWIEFSISNIIRNFRGSEIRENGIYNSGFYYKWSKVKGYSWISANTIQFQVSAFAKSINSFTFVINEESKSKVDEIFKRKTSS